jgi:hypothetical protein
MTPNESLGVDFGKMNYSDRFYPNWNKIDKKKETIAFLSQLKKWQEESDRY